LQGVSRTVESVRLFPFQGDLSARRVLANVLCEARDRYAALRFVLNPVDAAQYGRSSGHTPDLRGKSSDRVETNSWARLTFMRERDLDAIREARERDAQVRMIFCKMVEGFLAGAHDCRLQLRDRFVFQTSSIGETTRGASHRGRQPCVGVDLETNASCVSGHGCSQGPLRTLPGSPGNSRDRRRRASLYSDLCKWCSIFRMRNVLLFCRKRSKRPERAFGPPRKLYLTEASRGKADIRGKRRGITQATFQSSDGAISSLLARLL
jgi:hypothetical protein